MSGLSSLCSEISKFSSPTRYIRRSKADDTQHAMATMVKSVIDAVMTKDDKDKDSVKEKQSKKKKSKSGINMSLKDQSLNDLITLVDKHQNYLKFLECCNMLTPEKNGAIVTEIESVFEIIASRLNKRSREDIESSCCNSSVS